MSTETDSIVSDEEKREGDVSTPETEETTTSRESEAVESEATAEETKPSSEERTIQIDVAAEEGEIDTDRIVDDILNNEQIRQTIESRIFSSGDQKLKEYIKLKQMAERRVQSWTEALEATDPLFEPERRSIVQKKIDKTIEEIGKYEQKIRQLRTEVGVKISLKSNKMDSIRQRMEEVFDRDVIFAILVLMFPQMEWTTLQSIFRKVIKRIGEDVIPTIAQQRSARMQQQDSEEKNMPVVTQSSLIKERISGIIRRVHASIEKREVAGETVEVISFNKEDLPEVGEYIREEYRDIILFHVIPTLVSLVCEENLKWGVRQQIGYAIGDFMQQATSRIYDLLTAAWVISDDASIRATTGYLLSRAVEKELSRESVISYLKRWTDSGNVKLQWTAASVCKEIGKVDIELALDGLQQVLRSQPDASVLSAVAYSLVVLSLNGYYREVISSLSQWIVEEERNFRKIYILIFLDTFNTFLTIVLKELQRYEREEIGNQDNIESKSIEALWRILTQQMEDDFQKAIVDILVTVISSPADSLDILLNRFNVDLLGRWLDAFSQEDDKQTYEPEVNKIVENLLVEVYNQLASFEVITQSSVSDAQKKSRREKRLAKRRSRRDRTSEHQKEFWRLIKPWQEEPKNSIKLKVFKAVSRRVKTEGRRAHRGIARRVHRNNPRRRW